MATLCTPYADDVFSGEVAARYATFRPSYPDELFQIILSHLSPHQRGLAVDVATGSGQAALQLAQHFRQVVGIDSNEAQLSLAPRHTENVKFLVCDAHVISLPDGVADLITVASALHWMRLEEFYTEARRLLAPHGCLAAWAIPLGIARLEVPAAPRAAAACQAALHVIHEVDLGELWDERKRLADQMYRGIEPGPAHFGRVEHSILDCPVTLTVDAFAGYVSSWSAYALHRKLRPTQPDPLPPFRERLLAALAAEVRRTSLCMLCWCWYHSIHTDWSGGCDGHAHTHTHTHTGHAGCSTRH